jgi:hypothetical protein
MVAAAESGFATLFCAKWHMICFHTAVKPATASTLTAESKD